MKRFKLLTTLALAVVALTMSAQSPIAVDWQMGQNNTAASNPWAVTGNSFSTSFHVR